MKLIFERESDLEKIKKKEAFIIINLLSRMKRIIIKLNA